MRTLNLQYLQYFCMQQNSNAAPGGCLRLPVYGRLSLVFVIITAARAGLCQPGGCAILHVSYFLLNESPSRRPNAVCRQIWQDVGPDW